MKIRTLHPWLVVGFAIALCTLGLMIAPLVLERFTPASDWSPFLAGCLAIGCVPASVAALALLAGKLFVRTQAAQLDQAPASTAEKVALSLVSAFVIIYFLLLLAYLFSGGWRGDWSWL